MTARPRREIVLLAVGLAGIAFALGFVADEYLGRFTTYRDLKEAVASVRTNVIAPRVSEPWERAYYYYSTRYPGEGVQRNEAGKTYPGYTLFSASFEPAAYLVDMQGRKLHEWRLPFSAAWPSPPHIDLPGPDKYIFFRRTHVFPNGDLLAIYEAPGHWPYAYGLIKLDRDSKILWRYADLANHDLEVAADGRIYTLVHQVRTKSERELKRLRPHVVIDDAVVVLSPEGKEIERISVLNAFVASRYAPLLNEQADKDVLHTNSLQIVTTEIARLFPFAREGQILLSHNFRGAISILDPRNGTIAWARQVSRHYQHTARFLANGTIGVFKNSDNIAVGGGSRVVAVDPASGAETWAFAGDEKFFFYSENRGSIQPLPNGNILVTESNAGRAFELTPAREIVWEYRVGHAVDGKTPAMLDALRIEPATLTFLVSRDGTAQKPRLDHADKK